MAIRNWDPKIVLNLLIHDNIRCMGTTQKNTACKNPIGETHRTRASQILRAISTIAPNASDFAEELEELAEELLCAKSKHNRSVELRDGIVDEWQFAIEEFVRKGGDSVMGEASDRVEEIQAKIADLQELLGRLKTG